MRRYQSSAIQFEVDERFGGGQALTVGRVRWWQSGPWCDFITLPVCSSARWRTYSSSTAELQIVALQAGSGRVALLGAGGGGADSEPV